MSTRATVGIVGAGRAGSALGVALTRVGWPVRAVSSRDPGRRAAASRLMPRALVTSDPAAVAAGVDLVLLAVPDDAIGAVASRLAPRPGTIVAHTSGVHDADVLRPAVGPGAAVGAFHPLVAFADLDKATEATQGAWVAIDGDAVAVAVLRDMAETLGARVVVLPSASDAPHAKAAYHAAAVLAAGGVIALLDAIAELGRATGMDEATSVEVYGSLVRQGLANAAESGVAGALTGPVARGDVGTVRRHLEAMDAVAPGLRELYLAMARRQLVIAQRRGGLDVARTTRVEALLEG